MFVCNCILLNHKFPQRIKTFKTRKITRVTAKIALGNLNPKRDWVMQKNM